MTNPAPGPAGSNQDKLAGLAQPTPAPPPPPSSGTPPWESKATEPTPQYSPPEQVVTDDETHWSPQDLSNARKELESERRLWVDEIVTVEEWLTQMAQEGDEAIDQQLSLLENAREVLEQVDYALTRVDAGTYGQCERCGRPIGKHRLRSFPRATLCKPCKEAEERAEAQAVSQATTGHELGSTFEPVGSVGTPSLPPSSPFAPSTSPQPRNGKGTAALVCGILGLVPFPITGFWLSLIAIILGWQGYKRTQRGEATNEGVAMTGFVLGIIGMGIQFLLSLAIAFS